MEPNVPGANFINPTPPNEAMKKNGSFNVFLLFIINNSNNISSY